MKPNVKIQFSAKELKQMHDVSFLLSKRVITEKVIDLLHGLKENLEKSPLHHSFPFPAGVDYHHGRISRGENLKGLPFVVLDFPRLFAKENIFAFRTLFWWGNYFSFTLHLHGKALRIYQKTLLENLAEQKKKDFLVYTGSDQWEHDLSDEYYILYKPEVNSTLKKMDFLKLCRKIDVKDFEKVNEEGLETYNLFLSLMSAKNN